MPFEYIRWTLAERFHWTLTEVDALSMADLEEFFQIEDGKAKAGRELQPAGGELGKFSRRRGRR
jgi:hypothetical protein